MDSSWKRALNMALKNGLVFGRDFIFTYGPLGFLNTRNNQYLPDILLFLGDVFLFSGFYHFTYKYISGKKGWFFIVLAALILLRGSSYVQNLYIIFVVFAILCVISRSRNYFELAYCAASGILLFFIKINYGFIAVFFLVILGILLLF